MANDDSELAEAAARGRAAMAARMRASQTVTRASTMLRLAEQGLHDLQGDEHDRILSGFLAMVVFGRSMTLVMENLRSHDRETFESWYAPWRQEMHSDPLLRYFRELRNKVVHREAPMIGILLSGFGSSLRPIGSITVDDMPLPKLHLGQPLEDGSMRNLSTLYVNYLKRMFESYAPVAFAVQDRLNALATS